MTNEDYIQLHDLLWQRIMHLAIKKINFGEIEKTFSEIDENIAYNTVQLIIQGLSRGEAVDLVSLSIRNNFLQIGYMIESSDLIELVNEINENNQDEIKAVQVLKDSINQKKSWETTCLDVENTLFPNGY